MGVKGEGGASAGSKQRDLPQEFPTIPGQQPEPGWSHSGDPGRPSNLHQAQETSAAVSLGVIGTSLGCHQQRALCGGERNIGTSCCVEVGGKVQGFHLSRWALTPPWTAGPSPIRLLRLVPCQPSSPASARTGILRTPVSSAWGAGRHPDRSVIGAAGSAEPGAGVYKVGITP